jgi:hypothetical protein
VLGPASVVAALDACQDKVFTCDAVMGLAPEGIAMRQNMGYVDRSKVPGQSCSNCQQFVPAPNAGQCGSCKVLPGPAHPKGHCKVWAQRA